MAGKWAGGNRLNECLEKAPPLTGSFRPDINYIPNEATTVVSLGNELYPLHNGFQFTGSMRALIGKAGKSSDCANFHTEKQTPAQRL